MHELALAEATLDAVLDTARKAGAVRVTEVVLEVGALRQVEPQAFELGWSAVTAETIAAGARLVQHVVPVTAECRQCGARFAPEIEWSYECPSCQAADAWLVAGNDVLVRSMVCETADATGEAATAGSAEAASTGA